MLTDRMSTNEELLAALDGLERLTRQREPDEANFAAARPRLSRTSSKRRRLVDAACDLLLGTATNTEAGRVCRLCEINGVQFETSTSHIGTWGLRQVMADWPDYRRASLAMRKSIRALIAIDRNTRYRLLQVLGR